MTQIEKDYKDIARIEDYGHTYENRTISLLKVNQVEKELTENWINVN